MAKYGMAINLNTCVGCGACGLACKTENNTEYQQGASSFNWADFIALTKGDFPSTKHIVIPVLCNHCTNAPCVAVCPVTPKAMFKTAEGITMHNDERCIGCRFCQDACPYSSWDMKTDPAQYSVISYNPDTTAQPHSFWTGNTAVIPSGTATPKEIATATGATPPYKNDFTHPEYSAIRRSDVVEKCYFCDHRLKNGEKPYCVVSCPAGSRVFGDLDDPASEISLLIANGYKRLANNDGDWLTDAGVSPNVYYVGEFDGTVSVQELENKHIGKVNIYPNPVLTDATARFELEFAGNTTIGIYAISGQKVAELQQDKFMPSGKHELKFDVYNLKPGTYICSVKTTKEILSANFVVQ